MRTKFLDVPVDIFTQDDIPAILDTMLEEGKHHIIFLSLLDFMRARRNQRYMTMVKKSSLVVLTSMSVVKGMMFARKNAPQRFMPFDFMIKMLGHLDERKKSLYILGSRPNELQTISGNLRTSFPGLLIVGRHTGYYSEDKEQDILTAIKKAAPSCTICGRGVPKKQYWIHSNKNKMNDGLFIWSGECFDIFSGKKEKPSAWVWETGLKSFFFHVFRPWYWYRLLIYLYFLLLTLFSSLFKRKY